MPVRRDQVMTTITSRSLPETKTIASVRPPAKLNLFLELLSRRDDGFHEIDTVMVPIDWCDQLQVRRVEDRGVRMETAWLPSDATVVRRLGVPASELSVPQDDKNLVCRALARFIETFEISGGFECQLRKSIPMGAGMGGASSDAAAALRSAALLCGVPPDTTEMYTIAAEIGSDVPFFLGIGGDRVAAARARGRGERLEPLRLAAPLQVVVVFPQESLSTARVYEASRISPSPRSAERLIQALHGGNLANIEAEMMNRLSQPAQEIAPRIEEILKSMWRAGLRTCQLTGSGSACFAIANSARDAKLACSRLRARLEPGAFVAATRTTHVPSLIEIE